MRAGTICKRKWFQKKLETDWAGRTVILFCVGASPSDNPETAAFIRKLQAELKGTEVFYCPGGFCYEKMPVLSRLMMRAFLKSLRAKREKTAAEEKMVKMISSSYDISDRKYIAPIVARLEP